MISSKALHDYLARRSLGKPWETVGETGDGFAGAIVIPSLAESEDLFATLESIATNPTEYLETFLVVVVINNREDGLEEDKRDNLHTLELLHRFRRDHPQLRLAWVDAASPGRELPARGGGVGMARKIGFDLALPHLRMNGKPLLIALDADTRVRSDYLPAISGHFAGSAEGGASIAFCHQPAPDDLHNAAIIRYELFLRSYVLGLSQALSPYAFHTVGSAMACTVEAYLKMGGMNTRSAGEDFYFLQQLYRTSGVSPVIGTVVHPSARPSHRVPFGTGRSISRQLAAGEEVLFYRPECFALLGEWLKLGIRIPETGVDAAIRSAAAVSPDLVSYLEVIDASGVLHRLKKNHSSPETFGQAFHTWFDGLKTMRLIHHLCTLRPRCPAEEAVPSMLAKQGIKPASSGMESWLQQMRFLQNGCSCAGCLIKGSM